MTDINHFNSQPREGGWANDAANGVAIGHFNSQPREGGWIAQTLAKTSN